MENETKNSSSEQLKMIELRDISKVSDTISPKTYVLRDLDLEVKEGDFLSIVGSPDSGKSTLLHIIGLLEPPSNGEYSFRGQEIQKLDNRKKQEIRRKYFGFIFPDYCLNDNLTIYENVETPLLDENLSIPERKEKVADALERFHIIALKNLLPFQLSKVQRQLAAVARSMISNPKLILADEPTGYLNPKLGRGVMELLKRLNKKGTTIIQATQFEDNAAYSSRVLKLNKNVM
jgi:ABC-type lipoprotein export system ATPase subunit